MNQMTELFGSGSSTILPVTLMRQVDTRWRTRATAGVSIIGQRTASVG